MQAAAVDNPRLPLRPVLVWAALVAIISGLGLIPFYAFVPDLSKFTGNLPAAQLALLGIAVELAAVGPSLAAILVAWRMPGAGGARSLFRQFRHWRVHPIWYLIALLLPIPILLAADVIWMALGRQSLVWLTVPGAIPFTIGAALVPPLGEEFGWRGFAQPRLQRRLGALWAAVIVGILWSTWHIWPVFVPGGLETVPSVGCGPDLHPAHQHRCHLRLDLQQHRRKPPSRHGRPRSSQHRFGFHSWRVGRPDAPRSASGRPLLCSGRHRHRAGHESWNAYPEAASVSSSSAPRGHLTQ